MARKLLVLAALSVAVSGCAQASVSSAPRAEVSQASGDFVVSNSKDGQAIFKARGLAPGASVTGTVVLRNTGRIDGELAVAQVDIRDRPGVNGGLLSQVVELAVQDVSRPEDPITRFAGRLGELDGRSLGMIGAGQTRSYKFTATLPDHGSPTSFTTGDNAYIGSGLTVAYTWLATAPEPVAPPPTGTNGAPKVSYRVVTKRLFRRGRLDVLARCDRPCRLTVWAKLPKTKRARKAAVTRRRSITVPQANKRVRVKIKLTKKQRRALVKRRALMARRQPSKKRLGLRVYVRATATTGETRTFTRTQGLRVTKKRR